MDPDPQIALAPWAVALNLLHPPAGDGEAPPPAVEVIPPPNAAGVIVGRDGRRYRVKDMAALAARIEAQAVKPRIDFDHRSEPQSRTFAGTTAAEGWVKNARVNARGGIDADLHLSGWALHSLRSEAYRYLSPALMHTADMELTGLSSVGLVNNPNLELAPLAVNNRSGTMDDETQTAEERDRALKAREERADERALNAARRAVDRAANDGKIDAAVKDYHLGAIQSHKDGIEAGLDAFDAMIAANAGGTEAVLDAGALKTLGTRVAPAGAPNAAQAGPRPAFRAPAGVLPPDEARLSLHGQISKYAQENGISYRDAVDHFGAMGY